MKQRLDQLEAAIPAFFEALEALAEAADIALHVMPAFLNELGVDEDDEEWLPILRKRTEDARAALRALKPE